MHKSLEYLKELIDYIPNKVIFLDIDGVIQYEQKRFDHDMEATCLMLAEKYNDDIYIKMKPWDVCAAYYDWNNIAIGIIHELLETTKSNIVLSSDWRESKSFEEMKALFRLYNLDRYFIDCCNPKINKIDAINEYINKHNLIKYMVIDDRNFFQEFGEKYRNTSAVITMDDYYYIRNVLNKDIPITEDEEYIKIYNLALKYRVDSIDDKKIMFVKEYSFSNFDYKYLLEYLFNYMIIRKDIDLYIFQPNNSNINNLKINGYKASDGFYYIFKDRYSSSKLNDILNKVKIKKL